MTGEPTARRSGDGTVYYQFERCTASFGNDVKRSRCTLPAGHLDENVDFHAATDGRSSFIWDALAAEVEGL